MIEQLEIEAMSLLAANGDSKERVRVSAAHVGNEIDVTARGKRGAVLSTDIAMEAFELIAQIYFY